RRFAGRCAILARRGANDFESAKRDPTRQVHQYLQMTDHENYKIIQRGSEKAVLLKGEWTPNLRDVMLQQNVTTLIVSAYVGWKGSSFAFLTDITFLERLELLVPPIPDPSPLYTLRGLRYLSIDANKDPLDFRNFLALETVALGIWKQQSYNSMFQCFTLRKIVLTAFPEQCLPFLSTLPLLENLSLTFCKFTDVLQLGELPGLTRFSLMNSKRLNTQDGIECCPSVTVLWVEQANALQDINAVAHLKKLRTLILKDCTKLSSLRPVADLSQLETVGLMQSTNVADGDLSPLERLPHLRNATFKDRRHYSHQSDHFPKT